MNSRINKLALGHLDMLVNEDKVRAEFPVLLRELATQDLLPAIVFCLDREGCMQLAEAAVANMENLKVQSNVAFRARGKERNFTLNESSNQEIILNKAIAYLKPYLKGETHEFLIDALRFGIGVHHGGLPARYRLIVEGLFRIKILSVVIATGTLACGINTPCRTVVFATDCIYLDSINHLQMMGRAGRRGFDQLGYVVYFGLSFQRVKQLLCWPLQPLVANFPVSSSLVLRTLCLETQFRESQPMSEPGHAESVTLVHSRIRNLFKSSFYANGHVVPEMQILHQTRFSLEYFLKNQLINRDGHLVEAAGMVSHLFYTEPSNLVFSALLSSGILDELMKEHQSTKIESKAEYFLTIFASFFHRMYRKPLASGMPLDAMLVLPDLPDRVLTFIEDYNRLVLQIFTSSMSDYGSKCLANSVEDSCLPLSKLDLSTEVAVEDPSSFDGTPKVYSGGATGYVRSLFSSLSGNVDTFSDAYDFTAHIRAGISLDEVSIPTFDLTNGRKLSAYIVDFASHGDMKRIEEENGIKSGYVYEALYDAELLLATVAVSITRLAKQNPAHDFVAKIASKAAAIFREKMKKYSYMKPPNNLIENDPLKS